MTTGPGVHAEDRHRDARDETQFFDWIRHYGAYIAVLLMLGLLVGFMAASLLDQAEASTLIVDRAGTVSSRELGSVAEAVFRSDAVVSAAMNALAVDISRERFLAESVELRPVPDSRILIVVGRAPTARRAREISSAMSESLISAMAAAGLEGLSILSAGTPPGSLSPITAIALGGFAGLWFGVGTAIAWYYARRPVLSLRRALDILPSDRVSILDGHASWSGALRRIPRPRKRGRNEQTLAHVMGSDGPPAITVPGSRRRVRETVARRLHRAFEAAVGSGFTPPAATAPQRLARQALGTQRTAKRVTGGTVLVVDAGTSERDLAFEASQRQPGDLQVLWVR